MRLPGAGRRAVTHRKYEGAGMFLANFLLLFGHRGGPQDRTPRLKATDKRALACSQMNFWPKPAAFSHEKKNLVAAPGPPGGLPCCCGASVLPAQPRWRRGVPPLSRHRGTTRMPRTDYSRAPWAERVQGPWGRGSP